MLAPYPSAEPFHCGWQVRLSVFPVFHILLVTLTGDLSVGMSHPSSFAIPCSLAAPTTPSASCPFPTSISGFSGICWWHALYLLGEGGENGYREEVPAGDFLAKASRQGYSSFCGLPAHPLLFHCAKEGLSSRSSPASQCLGSTGPSATSSPLGVRSSQLRTAAEN